MLKTDSFSPLIQVLLSMRMDEKLSWKDQRRKRKFKEAKTQKEAEFKMVI